MTPPAIFLRDAIDRQGVLGRHGESSSVGRDVLVVDPVAGRRDAICRTITEVGGKAHAVPELSEEVGEKPTRYRLALMALGNALDANSPELEFITRFRQAGTKVVAYEDGVQHWSMRARCLPLLAGAERVLDSRGVQFAPQLRCALEKALLAQDGKQTAAQLVQSLKEQGIVGNSPSMLAVFRKAIHFGNLSDLPVLITGETGTGKELLARAIHRLDPKRWQKAFVPVNCAAINPGLVESELFGHRRGAFTGAERDRKGLIRAAEGGVLFLDEIGELDLGLQAKLLRVLQENSVLALGEEREAPVNVRFIAATNRDLERMVAEQTFRADLFHRLRGLVVQIPPLRERSSDFSLLIEHFVCKHHTAKGQAPPRVSADFVEAFRQLDLPGNARELEHLVREALVNHERDGELGLNDLPLPVLRQLTHRAEETAGDSAGTSPGAPVHRAPEPVCDSVNVDLDHTGWNLSRTMSECERQILTAVMVRTRGNQSEAARLLGITARSVYTKLKKYRPDIRRK
jgi:transcriptional regulator with GAF, ATPase, and Fis domain